MIGDRSCSVDWIYILEFLIFESQLCRLCQCIIPSAVPATTFGWRLPCISQWRLKASQFSWLLPRLRRIRRWVVVQWLLRLTFGWLLLCGFGFLDDISVEMLGHDRFVCSIRCCVPFPFSEYHISGAVKRLGQWIVYEILLSRYAVPNEYAGSGSVIQLLLFLFRNVEESQASEQTEMLHNWLPPMPGLVRGFTDYRLRRSAVLEIDCHWECKCPVLLRKSGIVQHASYALHDRAVCLFDDSIRPRSVGPSRFL